MVKVAPKIEIDKSINQEMVKYKSSLKIESESEDTRTVRYKKVEVVRPEYV